MKEEKERYSSLNEAIIRRTNSDDEEGIDITLMFEWSWMEESDESPITITYTVSTDEDQVSMVAGQPRSDSLRGLIAAANNPDIKYFELIIDAATFPHPRKKASANVEVPIHLELDGPMSFREFILEAARQLPLEEDEAAPELDDSGPSPKDRIN